MYIKINDLNIYYQKVGRGPNLILLHGWKQDVSTWWGVVDDLKEDFTLWLIDLPGFGRSDSLNKAFTVTDFANSITELIKKNKIKNPTILGHSLGGSIAIKIAYLSPTLVDKLILDASSGIRSPKNIRKSLYYFSSKVFNKIVPDFFNLKEKLRYKFYKKIRSDYLEAGNLKTTLRNILKEDLSSNLSGVKNETLIIAGEKDREVSLNYSKKIYQLIPNSRIEVFEGVGHFPHLENKERFVSYVKDFI